MRLLFSANDLNRLGRDPFPDLIGLRHLASGRWRRTERTTCLPYTSFGIGRDIRMVQSNPSQAARFVRLTTFA